MKSGKKVIRVALAILCMVSMLFISEYQKVEVYAASGYGFIFLSAYGKNIKNRGHLLSVCGFIRQ